MIAIESWPTDAKPIVIWVNRRTDALKAVRDVPPDRECLRPLKQFRAIAIRYDKTARNCLEAMHLAAASHVEVSTLPL